MARPDIRIRIRGRVIRIRIRKTGIRAVIRITAEQDTARATNLYTSITPNSTVFPMPASLPKGEVYQLLLRRFGAVEMLVGFIGGDFQEIQRAVILHRIVVILHCRSV